jgi:hypothetical protein
MSKSNNKKQSAKKVQPAKKQTVKAEAKPDPVKKNLFRRYINPQGFWAWNFIEAGKRPDQPTKKAFMKLAGFKECRFVDHVTVKTTTGEKEYPAAIWEGVK